MFLVPDALRRNYKHVACYSMCVCRMYIYKKLGTRLREQTNGFESRGLSKVNNLHHSPKYY